MDWENERSTIERIREGDHEAFGELVKPLIAQAYRTSLAIVGAAHLAEEAVQNALLESYSYLRSGKEIRHFRGWFGRLIANRSIDIVRKERNYKMSLDIDGIEIDDGASSPLEDLLRKEQSGRLFDSVMKLELPYRTVLVLFYFQELSIAEIAAVLNVREGTVKSRLHHARLKLGRMSSLTQWFGKAVRA
ncbi:RNA polymerase sigma factor [Paenibacillus flagellatus]|uniref:RNA polymerase subunit sigma-70 n=1 Tax=Paenibacillus flagellatus TaxID=2211139 RepID=A0A2V5K1U3_9BACL|nr:sigma-70 family RNA polymerase sigma factor [Paenibacillus flagellatus]PYI52602.1 RNA polymerase subunit sigma-70 [Paenibacillus flagellatus]